jgi:hypothetical protein
MLFFLAFHFSLSLTPNCRNWSPNYSVLVLVATINLFSWIIHFGAIYVRTYVQYTLILNYLLISTLHFH